VVVPSLVPETFGYVVLEAFAEGTPVIARELGALPELVAESQGGLTFDSPEALSESIDRLTRDRELRDALGANGRLARRRLWSEEAHLERYFDLIDRARSRRRAAPAEVAEAPEAEAVAS
jgi:glycosyltransferase involved in cell wall biosynthesis